MEAGYEQDSNRIGPLVQVDIWQFDPIVVQWDRGIPCTHGVDSHPEWDHSHEPEANRQPVEPHGNPLLPMPSHCVNNHYNQQSNQ